MRHLSTRRLLCIVVVALSTLALSVPVFADDIEQAEQQEDQATQGEPILEEIVVTAQKREETVKEVPISVTALPEATLGVLTAGGADVKFLSGRVPSLVAESSFGRAFPRFYIRGLGNTDFDLNASQPVSMIYDEVVLENPIVKGMPVFDLNRVEVLRGPQGTLFGRNTPAGAIKFESVKPSQDFEAYLRGSYGTFDTADLKGAIGGGLTDTLSARLAFTYQSRSDWVENAHTGVDNALGGYDNLAYRLQFLWEPNDRFEALVNVHGWDVDGTARLFRANIIKPGTNQLVDDFDQETVFFDGLNQQDISAQGGVINLNYAFESGNLISVTGFETLDMFSRGDIDGGFGASFAPPYGPGFIPFYSETSDGIPSLDQFTQEIRWVSNLPGDVQWLGGLYYFNEEFDAETYSYVSIAPGHPVEGLATQTQEATSYAFFGSVDYTVNDNWALKAGIRYTDDEKDFAAERPIPVFQSPTIAPVTASTDDSFVNWDLSATYKVSPLVNVYGRIATGSRAPSIQGRILFAADFEGGTNPASNGVSVADTEDLISGEIGVKTDLLNRRLRWNTTLYMFEIDGQQLTAVGGQFNTATLLNADKTEGYGLETDLNWRPNRSWLVTLGFSYNKTEIKDPNLTVAPCGGGCEMLDPVVDGLAYINGNSLPHAPKTIFNGIIDYFHPVGAGEIIASVDWAYHGDKHFFLYDSKEFHADSFELGLRLGYGWADGKYSVTAFGRNVTDEEIIQNGIDFNNLTGMTNDPTVAGVEFKVIF